jgi:hypothetical protein
MFLRRLLLRRRRPLLLDRFLLLVFYAVDDSNAVGYIDFRFLQDTHLYNRSYHRHKLSLKFFEIENVKEKFD